MGCVRVVDLVQDRRANCVAAIVVVELTRWEVGKRAQGGSRGIVGVILKVGIGVGGRTDVVRREVVVVGMSHGSANI